VIDAPSDRLLRAINQNLKLAQEGPQHGKEGGHAADYSGKNAEKEGFSRGGENLFALMT